MRFLRAAVRSLAGRGEEQKRIRHREGVAGSGRVGEKRR